MIEILAVILDYEAMQGMETIENAWVSDSMENDSSFGLLIFRR